jgi:peptidoglycan/xylan/chitin deacetylase (PgdA/CDA1 family)
MYHDVYGPSSRSAAPRSSGMYHLSSPAFASHLDAIERAGLEVTTVGRFLAVGGGERSVALTFDDGWAGTFTQAVPALLRRDWRATVFITRDFIGRPGFCDAAMIRDAAAAGVEIGVHGTTHRMLSGCTYDQIVWEFRACREHLESVLGQPVVHASLPGGDGTPEIVAAAREAGVTAICTSRPGVNTSSTPRAKLLRMAIRSSTTADDVARYCAFDVRRERARWALLQLPRSALGMRTYSRLRRMMFGEPDGHRQEVFKP